MQAEERIKELIIAKYGNVVKEWNSMTDASKTLKINLSCISMCCKGTRKKAGGFAWKYSECGGDSND